VGDAGEAVGAGVEVAAGVGVAAEPEGAAVGDPAGVGETVGSVVKMGVGTGVGVGLGCVRLPWPRRIAYRNTSPKTTATATTHQRETGSSTYGSVSPPVPGALGGRPLAPGRLAPFGAEPALVAAAGAVGSPPGWDGG
jgi:hypothetical protein